MDKDYESLNYEKDLRDLRKYTNYLDNCDHATQLVDYEARIEVLLKKLSGVNREYEEFSRDS